MEHYVICRDHYTRERKKFIEAVSPFHLHESRLHYMMAWVMALVFGTRMPHENPKTHPN